MSDGSTVSAALASIKAAAEIATLLRSSDLSLEKAEMKLRLAELIASLADAKMQVVDLREVLLEQQQEVQRLEDAFQVAGQVKREGDAYYLKDGNRPIDGPFCVRCWETDHRTYMLVRSTRNGDSLICQVCSSTYERRRCRTLD